MWSENCKIRSRHTTGVAVHAPIHTCTCVFSASSLHVISAGCDAVVCYCSQSTVSFSAACTFIHECTDRCWLNVLTDAWLNVLADVWLNVLTDVWLNVLTDALLNVLTDALLNVLTDVWLNVLTDALLNVLTDAL